MSASQMDTALLIAMRKRKRLRANLAAREQEMIAMRERLRAVEAVLNDRASGLDVSWPSSDEYWNLRNTIIGLQNEIQSVDTAVNEIV